MPRWAPPRYRDGVSTDRVARASRGLGAALWVLVALTVVLDRGTASVGALWRSAWAAGVLAHLLSASPAAGRTVRFGALGAEAACVVLMVASLCHGFEGLLLLPIALQLSLLLEERRAMAAVLLQTAAFGMAIALHWSARPAWMLALPYGVLQALLLVTGVAFRREADARSALAQAHRELRALGPLLEEGSRNAERVRISRELHDAAGHQVTALALQLEVARHQANGLAAEPIEAARAITRDLLDRLQAIVASSQRTDREGLSTALHAVASLFPRPAVHLSLPETLQVADAERAHVLLRCSQEILTNSAKHSGASHLWLQISQSATRLRLLAEDDGRIRLPVEPGNGLRGMRARLEALGGTLELGTSSRGGLELQISLPNVLS